MSPRNLFRLFAFAEAVTWAFLLIAMFLKYVTQTTDAVVPIAGGLHGFVFLSYVLTTSFVWVNQRWSVGRGMLGLVSSVLPFTTIPFELVVDRKGGLDGPWRLVPGGDAPHGFIEHVQAWVLRRPFVAIGLGVLAVAAVFVVLLILGPPIPKG
ncbi:DUF3817 domain-containing protein [Lysinibacter cavernae]|uniref:Integral membrane protein n=1 Tax=Lysinibacter cavernae TaxID=1640652 RepID=A0A7X5R0H2_9MICO|nr:DUF3817 domain-containing protein [Lysinibacter cavernae]NIH53356.1 integral membrane protein [Lysinibacter cavernae]